MAPLFANCKNLYLLVMELKDNISPFQLNAVRKCLKSNKQLKHLALFGAPLFKEDFSTDIGFQLRKLIIGCCPSGRNRQNRYETFPMKNINSFLKTQVSSLETLTLYGLENAEILRTILSMLRLKSLTLRVFSAIRPAVLASESFAQSKSITYLNIERFDPDFVFKLSAFPNVEILKIETFDDESANVIAESCKSLKKLSVRHFFAMNISNEAFFLGLKEFTCKTINTYQSAENMSRKVLFEKLNVKYVTLEGL